MPFPRTRWPRAAKASQSPSACARSPQPRAASRGGGVGGRESLGAPLSISSSMRERFGYVGQALRASRARTCSPPLPLSKASRSIAGAERCASRTRLEERRLAGVRRSGGRARAEVIVEAAQQRASIETAIGACTGALRDAESSPSARRAPAVGEAEPVDTNLVDEAGADGLLDAGKPYGH